MSGSESDVSEDRLPETAPPDAAADDAATLERRAFVRRMGTDAVKTAGTVFGLTRILTRTAVGVGQQMVGELERMQVGNAADEVEVVPPVDDVAAVGDGASSATADGPLTSPITAPPPIVASAPAAAAAPAAAPIAPARPTPEPAKAELRVDPADLAILEAATSGVVAVNREGHPPQLTTAKVLWDGSTLRFLTLGWARRTSMLRQDPRVGLLVDGPDGRFVTVAGTARIVDDRSVKEAAWPVLLREHGDEASAEAAWLALVAEDADRAVIMIEPEQVLAGRR